MIKVKPVDIIGLWPAHLTIRDEFSIEDLRLQNPDESRICFLAISHFPISVWQLQGQSRFFAHVS